MSVVKGDFMEVQKPNRKCQFYIVLGTHDREFKNSKYYQYFPVGECKGDKESIAFILKGLGRAFEKKKSIKQQVEDHLIFLIPEASYFDQARDLMKKLDPSGRIQIVPPLIKKEPPIKTIELPKEEKSEIIEEKVIEVPKEEKIIEEKKIEIPTEPKKTEEKIIQEPIPEVKVYKKNIPELPKNETTEDVKDFMWGDSKKQKLEKKKKKKDPQLKEPKPKKHIDLPVIIFILASILLVTSVILLFVLK